jgi:hypothetical protein
MPERAGAFAEYRLNPAVLLKDAQSDVVEAARFALSPSLSGIRAYAQEYQQTRSTSLWGTLLLHCVVRAAPSIDSFLEGPFMIHVGGNERYLFAKPLRF